MCIERKTFYTVCWFCTKVGLKTHPWTWFLQLPEIFTIGYLLFLPVPCHFFYDEGTVIPLPQIWAYGYYVIEGKNRNWATFLYMGSPCFWACGSQPPPSCRSCIPGINKRSCHVHQHQHVWGIFPACYYGRPPRALCGRYQGPRPCCARTGYHNAVFSYIPAGGCGGRSAVKNPRPKG